MIKAKISVSCRKQKNLCHSSFTCMFKSGWKKLSMVGRSIISQLIKSTFKKILSLCKLLRCFQNYKKNVTWRKLRHLSEKSDRCAEPEGSGAPCWPDAERHETPVGTAASSQWVTWFYVRPAGVSERSPARERPGCDLVEQNLTTPSVTLVFSSLRCSSPNLPSPLVGSSPRQRWA